MEITANAIKNNIQAIYEGIEKCRVAYKSHSVLGQLYNVDLGICTIGLSNSAINHTLFVTPSVNGLNKGSIGFSETEVQEDTISIEEYGLVLDNFIDSMIAGISQVAYTQWRDEVQLVDVLTSKSYQTLSELFPEVFGMVLDPAVHGYDIRIVDANGELLYHSAGECEALAHLDWDRLEMEIKLAWLFMYNQGLGFQDRVVNI